MEAGGKKQPMEGDGEVWRGSGSVAMGAASTENVNNNNNSGAGKNNGEGKHRRARSLIKMLGNSFTKSEVGWQRLPFVV